MLTVHLGTGNGLAVAVRGDRVEAVGPPAELAAAHPGARTRSWPGALGAGRLHEGPVPDAPSPRERVHALLRQGVTAVAEASAGDPAVRAALARAGVLLAARGAEPPRLVPGARADLAVFAADGRCLATVLAGRVAHRRA